MAAIFERHHQALQRYCYSILDNSHDAADALQNTMVKALRALPGETRQIALRPWLYRIAHNESISLLRARRPDRGLDAAAHVSDAAASDVVDSRERLRSLKEDLGELTERQRGALLMRELGGLEFTEVAAAMGTSAAAVKQSVYEARCALQALREGRALDCEAARRTLSDGDRRVLHAIRMRGHLRACAGCRDFELALHRRPAQLAAMIPPLPVTAAAGMLNGLLGGGSTGVGGLAAGISAAAAATTGASLVAKAATVVVVSAALASGARAVPALESASLGRSTRSERANMPTAASVATQDERLRGGAAMHPSRDQAGAHDGTNSAVGEPSAAGKSAGTPGGEAAGAGKPAGTAGDKPAGRPGGKPSGAGKPAGRPGGKPSGAGKPAGRPGGKPSGAGNPAVNPGGKPARTTGGEPHGAGKPDGNGSGTPGSPAASHGRP